jgi:hypothetical protein
MTCRARTGSYVFKEDHFGQMRNPQLVEEGAGSDDGPDGAEMERGAALLQPGSEIQIDRDLACECNSIVGERGWNSRGKDDADIDVLGACLQQPVSDAPGCS